MVPVKSGYREKDQTLELTTPYDEAYAKIAANEPDNYLEIIADFGVAIPVECLLSATLYLPEIHRKYFSHKRPTSKNGPVEADQLSHGSSFFGGFLW
jgi:hypothetical protein